MFGITDPIAYLIGVIIIIILPGPNSLYCLSVTVSQGKHAGAWAMVGILIGDTILILATALGVGTLLRLYPTIFDIIKLIGGTYLTYLGVCLLYGVWLNFKNRQALTDKPFTPKCTDRHYGRIYTYRSLMLSLTNPKAILFFLSFFIPFVDPHYPEPLITFFIMGLILQMISFFYLSLLIISGERLAQSLSSKTSLMIAIMVGVGILFIGFGAGLWRSQTS